MILSAFHRVRPLNRYRFFTSTGIKMATSATAKTPEEAITEIVGANDIVVFSGDNCPFCDQAVAALQEIGKKPFVKKASWEEREHLFEVTGSKSVPSIWLKGKFVGGCNDGPLPWMGVKKIIKAGKLEEYLK